MDITKKYDFVRDATFTKDHPKVVATTREFHSKALATGVFERFERECPPSPERAAAVAQNWYEFSSFMPWFLCQAAAFMPDNERRHYVIQTAFEELGMRDIEQLHCQMFRRAALLAGYDPTKPAVESAVAPLLSGLRNFLLATESPDAVLGSLLGLEVPAVENIQTVFRSLCHEESLNQILARDDFFKLHMHLEIEHVRLTVANFLRFCPTGDSKQRFMHGFDYAVEFWRDFWTRIGGVVNARTP